MILILDCNDFIVSEMYFNLLCDEFPDFKNKDVTGKSYSPDIRFPVLVINMGNRTIYACNKNYRKNYTNLIICKTFKELIDKAHEIYTEL